MNTENEMLSFSQCFSNLRKTDAHAVHNFFNIRDINIKTAVHNCCTQYETGITWHSEGLDT